MWIAGAEDNLFSAEPGQLAALAVRTDVVCDDAQPGCTIPGSDVRILGDLFYGRGQRVCLIGNDFNHLPYRIFRTGIRLDIPPIKRTNSELAVKAKTFANCRFVCGVEGH